MSPGTADAALKLAAMVRHGVPGTVLRCGAFMVHVALARVGLHQRHTLRLPPPEWMPIGFGLTMPLLLFGQAIGTRAAFEWYQEAAQCQHVVAGLLRDGKTGWKLALLARGWLHVCMGMNLGVRHRAWHARAGPLLPAFVVALPLTAAAGFGAMTRELAARQQGTQHPFAVRVGPAQRQALTELRVHLLVAYLGLVALALLSRCWRCWRASSALTGGRALSHRR